jgi:hypothetical protein
VAADDSQSDGGAIYFAKVDKWISNAPCWIRRYYLYFYPLQEPSFLRALPPPHFGKGILRDRNYSIRAHQKGHGWIFRKIQRERKEMQ